MAPSVGIEHRGQQKDLYVEEGRLGGSTGNSVRTWRGTVGAGVPALGLLLAISGPALAQELPLKSVLPAPSPGGCYGQPAFDPAAPISADAQEADQLSGAATQSAILGDLDAARDFLERAASLDPTDQGIAYELARTYESLGRDNDAVAAYCRYLSLAPDGPDAGDVRVSVMTLNPPDTPLPAAAADAFEDGVSAFEQGNMDQAGQSFSSAILESPNLAAAYYNRALVRSAERLFDDAIDDFREYLDLAPNAPDQSIVLERIGTLRSPPRVYNPTTALVAGIFIPGYGQFYTGRPAAGVVVLTAAAAAAGIGLLYTETEVSCRTTQDPCPPNEVIDETTTRPYMVPGLVAWASIAVIAAIEGFVRAKNLNAEAATVVGGSGTPSGLSLLAPTAYPSRNGGVTVEWVRLSF